MKIAILSCFYPYRGGISQFNASMLDELGRKHNVRAYNFKRQYPEFLFPGKTQFVTEDDEAVPVESISLLDTANPFTYGRTAREIRKWGPDLLLMRYWMPYFAPSLGYVARRLKGTCRRIAVLDNVVPHERHFFDPPLTRYFLGGCDGFITMSDSVSRELLEFDGNARFRMLPHPLYSHFGEKLTREEAERRLGLSPGKKNLLFFGLIRKYKGLDILLEAFRDLPEDYQLIIAGEPYGSFAPYEKIMESFPAGTMERVKIFTEYIRDSRVKDFFSAADVAVLPYRSATQSGISSIAYHFEVPMIVTDTGGLKSAIGDSGTGLVVEVPEPGAVRGGIIRFFSDDHVRENCVKCIRSEKERLSWSRFCSELTEFADTL